MKHWTVGGGVVALATIVVAALVMRNDAKSGPTERPPGYKTTAPVVAAPQPTAAAVAPTPTSSPFEPFATPQIEKDTARVEKMLLAFSQQRASFDALKYEKRDPKWAPVSEKMLKDEYSEILGSEDPNLSLNTYCATQTCAVVGGLSAEIDREKARQAIRDIQSIDVVKKMMGRGYWNNGSSFGASGSDNRRMFLVFYTRKPPRVPKG